MVPQIRFLQALVKEARSKVIERLGLVASSLPCYLVALPMDTFQALTLNASFKSLAWLLPRRGAATTTDAAEPAQQLPSTNGTQLDTLSRLRELANSAHLLDADVT